MLRKPSRNGSLVSCRRTGAKTPFAYSDYRRLSPDENEREGFSRKARRYVLKTVQRLTTRTATISARDHETLRTRQEYSFAKPELASEARKRECDDAGHSEPGPRTCVF